MKRGKTYIGLGLAAWAAWGVVAWGSPFGGILTQCLLLHGPWYRCCCKG